MMEIRKVSMKEYSSLHIGGEGSLVVVRSEEELKEAVSYAKEGGLRVHVLGGGTNTYFAEDLSKYLFIKPELKGILIEDGLLTAFAGEEWDDVVKYSVDHELWGIENLSRIPGWAGAAPIQNIGAYGVELKDTLESVRVFNTEALEFLDMQDTDCKFGYRDSVFKHVPGKYVIISISMRLSKEPNPRLTYSPLDSLPGKESVTLQEIRDLVINTRKMKLPDWREFPNTGSFFKNPIVDKEKVESLKIKYPDIKIFEADGGYKVSAAWLIEHVAKAKGVRVGNVGTWLNQPLVLVNYGNATADELNDFANGIQDNIENITGVKLNKEVNFVE